ncbi:hypothetical protein [Microcoleus sp.]|uniref:hypothetical protein n=1 Tax=Microcoleus sp. TaxID=44472 RepID=UPI0035933743
MLCLDRFSILNFGDRLNNHLLKFAKGDRLSANFIRRVCRHRQSFINSDNFMVTHLFFSRDEEKNQNFGKVRRYSESRFLLTDFCRATHPTATSSLQNKSDRHLPVWVDRYG